MFGSDVRRWLHYRLATYSVSKNGKGPLQITLAHIHKIGQHFRRNTDTNVPVSLTFKCLFHAINWNSVVLTS